MIPRRASSGSPQVAANARLYPGGTIYIDNDIALKRSAVSELFGLFDKMAQKHKDIGVSQVAVGVECNAALDARRGTIVYETHTKQAHICAPKQHHLGGVNGHFCA